MGGIFGKHKKHNNQSTFVLALDPDDDIVSASQRIDYKPNSYNLNHCTSFVTAPIANTSSVTPSIDYDNTREKAIDAIIDRLMADDNVNQRFIPDIIERKLYKNMMSIIIGLAQETIQNSSIDVLGHRLSFTLTPLQL